MIKKIASINEKEIFRMQETLKFYILNYMNIEKPLKVSYITKKTSIRGK